MSLEDLMETDAQNIISVDGVSVTLVTQFGSSSLKVVPQSLPVQPEPSSRARTNSQIVVVAVAKLDLPDPAINSTTDYLNVPGSWFRQSDATVSARIASHRGDDTDPGVWLLELKRMTA